MNSPITLAGIAFRPKAKAPMQTKTATMITKVAGLDGDAKGKPGKRQLTVLSQEQWQLACAELNTQLPWIIRRANLLIQGYEFDASMVGKQIMIGQLILLITGETDPCYKMDAQYQGLQQALTPDWRGGVCCTVLTDGRIKVGDQIEIQTHQDHCLYVIYAAFITQEKPMKLVHLSVILTSLAFTPQSQASWLDSIKSALGMQAEAPAEKPAMPNITDMVAAVTDKLGVSNSQATGGLASIFNYAKGNLSSEKFSGLSDSLPGLSGLLNKVPDISNMAGEGGLGGLMDKAANYSDSLKAANAVKKQFEALGLDPQMIMQYVNTAKAYLDTDEGKKIKDTLMQGLSKLAN